LTYEAVLIDVFNLLYRCRSGRNKVQDVVNAAIDRTEETLDHLKKNGKLYLLYDPIPLDDLGVSKVFKYGNGSRRAESITYKANRKRDESIIGCVHQYRKYWLFRGDDVISVYDDVLEADDYVEPIVPKYESVAMVTTDMDWSRYLSKNVDMIPGHWNDPYTVDKFLAEFGFVPTIASVTLNKVFFGDASDNIIGVLKNKKVPKVYKNLVNDAVKWVGDNSVSLKSVTTAFGKSFSMATLDYEPTDPLDNLAVRISSIDTSGAVFELLEHNVRILKSRCPDEGPFVHTNKVDEKTNGILEEALGRVATQKQFRFGKVVSS
jgi:hypothetical protein